MPTTGKAGKLKNTPIRLISRRTDRVNEKQGILFINWRYNAFVTDTKTPSYKLFDMVITNPPFGRSSSEVCERDDFWAVIRNKQLNFMQHVVGLLTIGGTASEGSQHPWTRELWVYDLRTEKHFTLKQNPLTRADLD